MQGYKSYEEKLFYTFRLSERVPVNNFYRRLKGVLDLSFIRKYTQEYYGKEGQTSIDIWRTYLPTVRLWNRQELDWTCSIF